MKHVLFRNILLTYLLIATLLLISLELYLSKEIKDNHVSNLKDSLIIQARLISDQIPSFFTNNLDDICRRFKEKTGARVTIIDSSGKVMGDSDEPSEKMENHSDRPEIKDAEISDVGSSIRYSKTIQKDLLYLAIAINKDTDKLASPTDTNVENKDKTIIKDMFSNYCVDCNHDKDPYSIIKL